MLYPGSRFRMADDLLEAYIRQLIEAHAQVPEVDGRLAGRRADADGARLLPRSVELAERYLRPGQRVAYTIQTNGTLLDDEWARSSASTTSWSGSRSTGRASCTTPTAWTRAARAPSTR